MSFDEFSYQNGVYKYQIIKNLILIVLLISLGFFIGLAYNNNRNEFTQTKTGNSISNILNEATFTGNEALERPSPKDRIKENQIKVYKDKVLINIKNAQWSKFTNTNSMDPIIDEGANAIEIVPKSPEDIEVGDIISYKSKFTDGVIIHRVIKKGYDNKGVYFILKGDNLKNPDPEKVRFSQILRVLVAIIY